MFRLRAPLYDVAAIAAWSMGIETKRLALETLLCRVRTDPAGLRVTIDAVR
jgi:hypothetical protein